MGIPTDQAAVELHHLLLSTAFTQPSNIWVGLQSSAPTSDTEYGTELSGNGYARVQSTTWEFSSRQAVNSTTITFPTATGDWSTAVFFSVYTSSDSTAFVRGAALDTERIATNGDTLRFSTGTLTISYVTSTDLS